MKFFFSMFNKKCCATSEQLHRIKYELVYIRRELSLLRELVESLKQPGANQVVFFNLSGGKKERVTKMILKVNQKLPLSVEFQDKFGNAAKVDGAPAWAMTDAELGALEIAEGGLSAVFTPSGKAGALKVQVSADADLGEGVKAILGELELSLIAGDAVSVAIKAGEALEV
jgi:hypothetical protein